MAKLQNKRIKNVYGEQQRRVSFVKPTLYKIKTYFRDMSKKRKIFLLSLTIANIIAMILIGIFTTSIPQSIAMVGLFICNLIAIFVFNFWTRNKLATFIQSGVSFFLILTLVSTAFLIYGNIGIGDSFMINREIAAVKKDAIKVISTDYADIYINLDKMEAYTISDIADQKYVNTNKFAPAEDSEYYFLYNVGIQMASPDSQIEDVYIYPPTPHTTTGYDYLLEIKYRNQVYVTKVFLPGYVDLNKNVSATMFALIYASTSEKYYVVNRIDEYLVFQSEFSTFSTPYKNVKYTSDQEYFYVRYNRYLEAYMESDDYTEIQENNVKFAKSLLTLSTTINKVNFFWIGEEINGQFVASIPVMEIVYDNGTCDIAIIKDISPEDLSSAVT